jgi:FkbM family methyltransferase
MAKKKITHIVYSILPKSLKLIADKRSFNKNEQNYLKYNDIVMLKQKPRYIKGVVNFKQHQLQYMDSASLLFIYDEIFNKQIYNFKCKSKAPVIIDAGANIGLSVIYFKMLYPEAKITAFEPDDEVFETLKNNVASFGFSDVNLIKKGLWSEETELTFNSEGADAGRISNETNTTKVTKIATAKLSNYLKNNKIDLLKIDIEGAEFEVLKECKDYLGNVEKLFVEYHSFIGKKQELSEIIAFITMAGLRIININVPGLSVDSPFNDMNNYGGMDLQLNIYATR